MCVEMRGTDCNAMVLPNANVLIQETSWNLRILIQVTFFRIYIVYTNLTIGYRCYDG